MWASASNAESMIRPLSAAVAMALASMAAPALAQLRAEDSSAKRAPVLDRVQVAARAEQDPPHPAVMPQVEDGRIYLGKKTTVVDLREQPAIANGNPRQVFAQVAGLFVSDQFGQGQWNLGWRGLGDPHESEFTSVLMNGVPIMSDWMTYNTLLWAPPLQRITEVQVTYGGAGLLNGPQPGPSINLVMRGPQPGAPLGARSDFSVGQHGFLSNYNEIGAGSERAAFLVSTDYRQTDGERVRGGSRVKGIMASGVFRESADAAWTLDLNAYQSFNQEAGRLSLAQWTADPDLSIRPYDDFRVQRTHFVLGHERKLAENTVLDVKLWSGYHDRWSRRAGTQLAGQPSPAFTTFDRQQFRFLGLDSRVVHEWGGDHTLTAGGVAYNSSSPRWQGRAADLLAPEPTTLRFVQERGSQYRAVFAENAFRLGPLSLVPALRAERVDLCVDETLRLASLRRPAIDRHFDRNTVLAGLGASYDVGAGLQVYGNLSEGYRPMRFDDVANPTAQTVPENDPELSFSRTAEIGVRGGPLPGLFLDLSVFRIDFDDKIEQRLVGVSDIERVNSGDARHQGVDLSVSWDAFAASGRDDSLKLYASNTWLDAEITRSVDPTLVGNVPQFAPDYLARAGLVYGAASGLKLMLSGTFSADQFWQDNNLPRATDAAFLPAKMPSYQVFDLGIEYPVNSMFTLSAGVANLFDKTYFSRIRTDGIEPAPGRFAWLGLRVSL